jgi:hypothetical protein
VKEPLSIQEALAKGDSEAQTLYERLTGEVPRHADRALYRRWMELVQRMPRVLYRRTDVGDSPHWDPVGSLLWYPSDTIHRWNASPQENPFKYTGFIVGMHSDSIDLVEAVLSVMYAEYGIQPLVPGLVDESVVHVAMARFRQSYNDISPTQLRNDVYTAANIAAEKLAGSGAESSFVEQATRFLVLRRSDESVVDMMIPNPDAPDAGWLEKELNAVLESAPYLLSWLWWSARVVLNDPGQIDWGAHPWPWELD